MRTSVMTFVEPCPSEVSLLLVFQALSKAPVHKQSMSSVFRSCRNLFAFFYIEVKALSIKTMLNKSVVVLLPVYAVKLRLVKSFSLRCFGVPYFSFCSTNLILSHRTCTEVLPKLVLRMWVHKSSLNINSGLTVQYHLSQRG